MPRSSSSCPGLTITDQLGRHRGERHHHGHLYADRSQRFAVWMRPASTTPGTISLSYVAAVIPNGQEDYTTYTTRTATGTVLASIQQPGADSGGTATSVGPGQYQYTFHTTAPSGFDATATHTIGIYGSRNLTAYNLGTNYASATYNFVPNGAKVTQVHDIIETASCNACHDQLSAHGGSRRGMNMCVLCHKPQNTDPNTGLTLDAKVFFHKIHMGASLPSVMAGTPYIPAINSFGTFNYSTVVFPADPGRSAALRGVPFANHRRRAGDRISDQSDARGVRVLPRQRQLRHRRESPGRHRSSTTSYAPTCHIPQGEMRLRRLDSGRARGADCIEPALGLGGEHHERRERHGGKRTDGDVHGCWTRTGTRLPLSALGSISFTMAGPTTDYGYTSFGSNVTTPGYVTESASGRHLQRQRELHVHVHAHRSREGDRHLRHRRRGAANRRQVLGRHRSHAAKHHIWSAERGDVLLGGRLDRGAAARGGGARQLQSVPRRRFRLHGALRNNTEYCVMCHNPSNTDASTRATATVAADKAAPPQGINFNLLVHRIHYGINMQASNRTYIVVGFGGSHNDFSSTLFPALSPTGAATDTENCSLCHVNSTRAKRSDPDRAESGDRSAGADQSESSRFPRPAPAATWICRRHRTCFRTPRRSAKLARFATAPAPLMPSTRCMRSIDLRACCAVLFLAAFGARRLQPALPPGYVGFGGLCRPVTKISPRLSPRVRTTLVETDKKTGLRRTRLRILPRPGAEARRSRPTPPTSAIRRSSPPRRPTRSASPVT